MSKPIPTEVVNEIAGHVFAGHKIEAIKIYREHSGQGLKESKDFVDALEAELRAKEPGKFAPGSPGKGCLSTIAFCGFGVLGVLIVVVLMLR